MGWRCSRTMDRALYCRKQAEHLRELADITWQPELEKMLRDLARDYENTAQQSQANGSWACSRESFRGQAPNRN